MGWVGSENEGKERLIEALRAWGNDLFLTRFKKSGIQFPAIDSDDPGTSLQRLDNEVQRAKDLWGEVRQKLIKSMDGRDLFEKGMKDLEVTDTDSVFGLVADALMGQLAEKRRLEAEKDKKRQM